MMVGSYKQILGTQLDLTEEKYNNGNWYFGTLRSFQFTQKIYVHFKAQFEQPFL